MAELSESALRVRIAKDNLRRAVDQSVIPVIARSFPVLVIATLGAGFYIGKKRMMPNLVYLALVKTLAYGLPGKRRKRLNTKT